MLNGLAWFGFVLFGSASESFVYIIIHFIYIYIYVYKHTHTQHTYIHSTQTHNMNSKLVSSLPLGADSWLAGPLGVLSFLFSVLVSRTLVAVKEAPGILSQR